MSKEASDRTSTGVVGLDEILNGGFLTGRSYLVRGGPGTGKTITGLHFLTASPDEDRTSLFITLGESEERIRRDGAAMGFDLADVSFLSLAPESDYFTEAKTYDLFDASEVERQPAAEAVVERIETLSPTRIFVDSMTHFRYLAADSIQFRKQTLSFLQYLTSQGATVVFTSESSPEAPDQDLQFLSDGIIELEQRPSGRSVTVTKFRGGSYVDGSHGLRIHEEGLTVFPRLVPPNQRAEFEGEIIFMRYLEIEGILRKAIGVLKKRASDFEKTLREFAITRYGLKVGEPLTGLRGVLLGTPEWTNGADQVGALELEN